MDHKRLRGNAKFTKMTTPVTINVIRRVQNTDCDSISSGSVVVSTSAKHARRGGFSTRTGEALHNYLASNLALNFGDRVFLVSRRLRYCRFCVKLGHYRITEDNNHPDSDHPQCLY